MRTARLFLKRVLVSNVLQKIRKNVSNTLIFVDVMRYNKLKLCQEVICAPVALQIRMKNHAEEDFAG